MANSYMKSSHFQTQVNNANQIKNCNPCSSHNCNIPANDDWSNFPAQSNVNMANFLINNLGTPLIATDAATKGYVDGVIPPTPTLSQVLIAGNSAGSTDIDMNGMDISSVNDITMSGLVPTITATNVNANLTISSGDTLNMTTAGQMSLASGGILSLGGVTYTTCENLNINESAITKQGAVADITFDDLTSINTNSTTTPLNIGCGTTISLQPNQYGIGLDVNDVVNSTQDSFGVNIKNTSSDNASATGLKVVSTFVYNSINSEGGAGSAVGVNINNVTTKDTTANGLQIDTVTITEQGGDGNASGISITNVTSQDLQTNGILIDGVSSAFGEVSAVRIETISSSNTSEVIGINVKSLESLNGPVSLVYLDQIITAGAVNGVAISSINSSGSTANGFSIVNLVSEISSATLLECGAVNSNSVGPATGINIGSIYSNANVATGIQLGNITGDTNAYGMNIDSMNVANGTAIALQSGIITADVGDAKGLYLQGTTATTNNSFGVHISSTQSGAEAIGLFVDSVSASGTNLCQGIVVQGITAPSAGGYGINISNIGPREKARGLFIDGISSQTDLASAIYIGSVITGGDPATQSYGIYQEGSAQNVLTGATFLGASSTSSQMALTLGGSSVDKVQLFTGAGTIALNGGNIISAGGPSPYTLNLPASPLPGTKFTICKSVNATVTLNGNSNNINGVGTFPITGAQYLICTVVFINSTIDWIATL